MLNRRSFLLAGATAAALPAALPLHRAEANQSDVLIEPRLVPQTVAFEGYPPNTLVIDTANRFLYWVERYGQARRYAIGVGRAGLALRSETTVGRKAEWPRWTPTKEMIARSPDKYTKYANGVPGGPDNPLGARALYLFRDGRDTMFRIHGTNAPNTIGRAISNGCIRLRNEHVVDLYDRVPLDVRVIII